MPERKLPRESVDKVEASGQKDVDPDVDQDLVIVRVDGGRNERDTEAEKDRGHETDFPPVALHHQTFSASYFPKMPVGLKSRIRIRMLNAIASRYVGER